MTKIAPISLNTPRTTRLTIALLGNEFSDIPAAFLRGVEAAAEVYDANLLYIAGNALRSTQEFRIQSNILYDVISSDTVDALLIAANSLGGCTSFEALRRFCHQYDPLPMVSLGLAIEGIPSVIMDNARGMYDVVAHLIEAHGYRRIAFVCGPDEHPEAAERRQAYLDALHDHQIAADPALILPGDFQKFTGARAVAILLDERQQVIGRDVDAIVTANDYMAFGVMEELSARGLNAPVDVALAGFDDLPLARCSRPALTSVHSPFYEVGRQGLLLLLDRIAGKSVPMVVQVPTQAIVRQSCGCPGIHDIVITTTAGHADRNTVALDANAPKSEQPQPLDAAMSAAQKIESVWEPLAMLRGSLQTLSAEYVEKDAYARMWTAFQQMVTVLKLDELDGRLVEEIKQRIISTIDLAGLLEILATQLPRLGIRCGYLALYEGPPPFEFPQTMPAWSRLVLAYTENGRCDLPAGGLRFSSRRIVPAELRPQDRRSTLILEGLYFQQEQIGFALFDGGAKKERHYANLRGQISSAVYGTLLVEQIQQHAHELTAAYEEIRILNDQLKEENVRMSAELDVARRLQKMILPTPKELEQLDGLMITGYMQPADEVGGDYYDVLKHNGTFHIGIGDVTGHGLESGVLMLMTQTAIRTLIEHGETDPAAFVNTLNQLIYKNARRMGTNKTLTFALVMYQAGQIKIVGQHEDVLVVRHTGQIERIDTLNLGFPIGLEQEISQWVATASATLQAGDGVVLYTDGITEAENSTGELFGLERLCASISRHWQRGSVDDIQRAVVDDVRGFIGTHRIYDDITLVILKQP